jgi:hypothetical protein
MVKQIEKEIPPSILNEGDIVNIYTDYMTMNKFEGSAILVERLNKGHTYLLPNERMLVKDEDRLTVNTKLQPLNKHQKINAEKYNELVRYLEGFKVKGVTSVNKILNELRVKLVDNLSKSVNNYKTLNKIVREYRFKHYSRIDEVKQFFNKFTNYEIVNFAHQRYQENWDYTIYREERWKVKFIPEQYSIDSKYCLFNTEFVTNRKIATIVCISPEDAYRNNHSELSQHITNSKGLCRADGVHYDSEEDDYFFMSKSNKKPLFNLRFFNPITDEDERTDDGEDL